MSGRGQLKVLILEEQPDEREALAVMLGGLGFFKIEEAGDGREGLDLLQASQEGFGLVVCNLDMGGMDGLEFVRHAARLGVGGLILYSAHDDAVLSSAEWMARAYNAPLLGVLRSPFRMSAIEPLIAKLNSGYTVFSDVMNQVDGPEHGDRDVIDEIVVALDTRQFVPHYQPKIGLVSGELLGVEALARWEHVELGLLAPAHFVDLMESNNLIDPLTHLMLEQAGHHMMRWHGQGLHVPISINLSPLSLERPDCAKRLLATIAATGAEPSHFTFEITETAFAKDTKTVLENVLRLRMRGCGISVDDFGTGYSSLQQLNRTPITELKLDRSFVRRMMSNTKARSIIGSMIDLATRLKLKTVAEGLDTEQQRECLTELGCDMGQGYLFAKAMESDRLVSWWEARRGVVT